jgi:L-2-hydroxycarboxylate dehydrogenase (NAD+)
LINYRTRSIKVDVLRELMQQMAAAAGCDAQAARTIAETHLESDLRGISVQGLNHLVFSHIPDMLKGKINPSGKPKIVKEGDTFALIDGNNGPGPVSAFFAADVAVKKAGKKGVGVVGICNSHDIFQVGLYVERIARQDLIGFGFTDDPTPVIAALGGCRPVIGCNAMAIAVPAREDPFLLDFAPTATGSTFVRYAKRYGVDLPDGVAVDADGNPTTDPHAVGDGDGYQPEKGAILPAGSKGYGLLLVIDFLSGALTGCQMGTDHCTLPGAIKGHFFMAIDPMIFGDPKEFRQAVSHRIQSLQQAQAAPGVSAIRTPGEGSFKKRKKNLSAGEVLIDAELWKDTLSLCRKLGVKVP